MVLWIYVRGRDVAVGMQARKQLDKKRRASTTVCMNRLAGQLPMMHNAHPLRASLRAGDRSQQIMQPALWQQHSGLCVDSSPAVKILAVATLIYHNAMPNGPVLVDIVFQVLENALPTSTSLRRAGGPLGRHQHPTHRFARNTTPSTPATDSSRVAPPPVEAVECLQAGKQKTRTPLPPDPEKRQREVCDERDP